MTTIEKGNWNIGLPPVSGGVREKRHRMRRVGIWVSMGLGLLLLPAMLAGQGSPDEKKGFAPNSTFATSGLDNVNVFNGNLIVSIPLGPSYPIGADLSHQLRMVYNAKPWRTEWTCFDGGTGRDFYGVFADGSPVLGTGWSIEVGHIGPGPEGYPPGSGAGTLVYYSPDGAVHNFTIPQSSYSPVSGGFILTSPVVTDDTTFIRASQATWDSSGPTSVTLDFPDGSHGYFTQSIRRADVEHGGTAQDFHHQGLYLTKLASRYGDYLLVEYGAGANRWRVSQIDHYRRDGTLLRRPVVFRYDAALTVPAPSAQTPASTWTVLTGIDLPTVGDDLQYPATDPNAKVQRVRFDYYTTGFSRPYQAGIASCTAAAVKPEVAAPLLQRVTLDTGFPALKYEFDYKKGILSPQTNSAAALIHMAVPTGGSVDYEWDENYTYSNFDTIPIDRNCLLNPFSGVDCYRLWILRSTALLKSRTEQPSNSRWEYARTRTFFTNSLGGYQVTQVTGPDTYKVNHYFGMDADAAEQQVHSNGLEYQRDTLDLSGAIVRRTTMCYGGDGVLGNPVALACDAPFYNIGLNVRQASETTSTMAGGTPVQTFKTVRTNWDTFGHFEHEDIYDWGGSSPLRMIDRQ